MRLRKRAGGGRLVFEAFGVGAEIQYDAALDEVVRQILPPGWRPARARIRAGVFSLERTQEDAYQVSLDGRPLIEHGTLDVALGLLDAELRMLIATTTPDWVFVHAGVVALDERVVLIPGESFSGKSTLVRALVQANATYYSDEYAVLDEEGRVHPYPRRLSIRGEGAIPAAEQHVAELGGRTGDGAAEVAAVVVTRYRAGASWQPQVLSAGAGALALLANTVPAQRRPQECVLAIARALHGARVLGGDRGEAAEMAHQLMAELASDVAPASAQRA